MFKSDIPCRQCNKSYYIQNKTKHLCSECVYKNNHNGKSRYEVQREKQRNTPIKKNPIKYRRKKTGEKELFLAIWEERKHICNTCGRYLGEEPLVHYFSHIKSKGSHPELRLDKDNIELLCFDCHFDHEFNSKEK